MYIKTDDNLEINRFDIIIELPGSRMKGNFHVRI